MNVWRVPYPKFGTGPGLERIAAIVARLGVDLARFGDRGAVVVGSNGKGSTAAMCAALLEQADRTTGLFTSPHLLDLNERFRVGGEDISDDELSLHWDRVRTAAEQTGNEDKLGGFEFLFLIAADWFKSRGCVHTVWEAGLGGRLDPVRLIQARQLALTSLDFEHMALLGDSLEAIALEKVAAAPPNAQVFASADAIANVGAAAAIRLWCDEHRISLKIGSPLERAPLAGEHQRRNAALALSLAQAVAPLSEDQVRNGLAATRWPGRLETLSDEPLEVIDVGHTPEGVSAALAGFQTLRGERHAVLVCGVSADKDAAGVIARIAPSFSTIICAAAQHKGAPPAKIAAHAQAANPGAEIALAESVADARRLAFSKAKAGGAVYVAGGLFLAAEYKALHLGRDPASLVFF